MTTPGLPAGWALVALADAADAKLGKMLDRSRHTTGQRLAYLRNINVRWETFDLTDLQEMFFDRDELDRYGLRAGDVIICEGGEPGRAAVWPGSPPEMKFQKALHRVRPSNALLPDWLVLQLRHDASRGALEAHFTGTTIKHFTGTALANYKLALPPRSEQERIVAKLSGLRARSGRAKAALDTIPPLLDKLRQSILAAAFRGDLTADWRAKNPDVEPADQLLARIRTERRARWEAAELAKLTAKGKPPTDEKWKARYEAPTPADEQSLPPLPTSWAWMRVEELATKVVDGVHKKPSYVPTGIPFLTVKNLTAGPGISFDSLNYITQADHEEYTKRTDPEPGDLLISKDGTLGITRLVTSDRVFSIFVSLALVKPVLRMMGGFLELAFQSPVFQERFVSTGSGLQHIHLRDLRDAVLPIAPLSEQEELTSRVRAALARIEQLEARLAEAGETLAQMDQAILSKAFRGELVAQDPNDEPASVLLERIRASRAEAAAPRRGRPPRTDDASAPPAPPPLRVVPCASPSPAAAPSPRAPRPRAPAAPPPTLAAAEAGPTYQPRATSNAAPLAAADLVDHAARALWRRGPVDKDDAIRAVADHLRAAGRVDFQRLRSDGPLYTQLAAALDLAVKAGHLDRPRRGAVRACRPDPADYTPDDWRAALLAVLTPTPTDRDAALRAAADWARDTCGLAFERLRSDGHILTALRSAITSALRRGEIERHGADRIARAADPLPKGQLSFDDLSSTGREEPR